jgi:4-hydroxy-4-methyl-2-oxoglutarate aldolase
VHPHLPVWACGLSTVTGKRWFEHGEFCVAVSCGGVGIEPKDAVLADENGVLLIKPHEIAAAGEHAVGMQKAEQTTLACLTKGERLHDTNATIAGIVVKQKG